MVSNFRFHSFKEINLRSRVPFILVKTPIFQGALKGGTRCPTRRR